MTGNVHCTHFLTSGLGIKTKGDISAEGNVYITKKIDSEGNIIANGQITADGNVTANNYYWGGVDEYGNPWVDATGANNVWKAITNLVNRISNVASDLSNFITNRFNNHTHSFYITSARVSGQAIAKGVYLQGVDEQGNVVGGPVEGTEALNHVKKFRYGVILRTRDMDYEDGVEVSGTSSTPR